MLTRLQRWLSGERPTSQKTAVEPLPSGGQAHILKRLQAPPRPPRGANPEMDGHPMTFDLNDTIAVLERTPATFRALLSGLTDAWTTPNEGPDTFSAFDNLGHIIHGERADWIPRAEIILAQGANRTFEPFDRFAQVRESVGKSVAQLLDEFAALRAQNLTTLREWRLTEAHLALQGEHPALGPVSLRQLLSTWVAHDLGHLAQTSRVMAKQ